MHDAFTYGFSPDTAKTLWNSLKHLTLGIRPEDVEVLDGPVHQNSAEAKVDVVEPMGDETVLYVTLGEQTMTVNTRSDQIVRVGDTVHLLFPEDRIHLFDVSTGNAVKNREWTATDYDTTVEA